jgi:beta-glucosidase/6-phospho-beta-glucosidase/beta-galactosidase
MGGFEGADHLNQQGRALDMVEASGHLAHLDQDYARMAAWGLRTVRESVGWRLSERDGVFDFSRATRIARTARRHGVQVLWTLMHYGTPADVSLLDDSFCERFARFAAAAAATLADVSDGAPVYTPVNEVSFLAWAASETNMLHPYQGDPQGKGESSLSNGFDIKCRLVKAILMGVRAIRQVDPCARFLHIEPLVHVVAPDDQPELAETAAQVRSYQWQTWDMLAGRMLPELGGHADALDLIGVNHYHSGQWEVGTERRLHWHLKDPRRMPFARLLIETWTRYHRPMIVAETSHIGVGRAQWLDEIAAEVRTARDTGADVQGVCLYPIVDRPDWNDAGHWHNSGLWDHAPPSGDPEPAVSPDVAAQDWPRRLRLDYAKTLRRWQQRLPDTPTTEA